MRIRFINTYEPVSPFYRDLIPFLAEQGHEVEVILSSAEYRIGRQTLESLLNHKNILLRRIPCGIQHANSRSKKVWVILTYIVGTALTTMFGRRTDLNFFLTQPPLFQFWGRVLSLFRRQPYACLVMDLYPDVAIANEALAANSLFARIAKRISYSALKGAKRVVVIGRCMAAVIERIGVSSDKITMIPNWANENEITRLEGSNNLLRTEKGLNDSFVCLYSGNLGVSHRFDELLAAAEKLRDNETIQFVFIGNGTRRIEVESFRNRHKLKNIKLLPYQSTSRLSESLAMGDVHFVCLRKNFTGKVIPSKAYGALAAGKPIIYEGDPESEIALMVKEFDIGHVVEEGDVETLVDVLLRLHNDPEYLRRLSENSYRASQQIYSRQASLRKYVQLFDNFSFRE